MEQKRQRNGKEATKEAYSFHSPSVVTIVSFPFFLCLKNNYETTKRGFFYPPE